MDGFLSYAQLFFSGSAKGAAIAICGLVVAAAVRLFCQIKASPYRLIILAATSLSVFLLTGWICGWSSFIRLSQIIAAVVIAIGSACATAFGIYRHYDRELERVAQKNDLVSLETNPVEALSILNGIKRQNLIFRQVSRYDRYLTFTLIALGSDALAKQKLSDANGQERGTDGPLIVDDVFRHFFLHIIADRDGEYGESQDELKKAKAAVVPGRTDPLLVLEIELNHAVLNLTEGNPDTADAEFEKVRRKANESSVKNKDLWNSLYENIVLNKTRIGLPDGGRRAGKELLDEYRSKLDMTRPEDRGALFNLNLMFLRQIGASSVEKQELFDEEVETTEHGSGFTISQRIVGMASLARIAWSDSLNPDRVFDYLANHYDDITRLSPEDRYMTFFNVGPSVMSFSSDTWQVERLREGYAKYILGDAELDLLKWEEKLPQEAVKARAFAMRERASVIQRKGDLDRTQKLME